MASPHDHSTPIHRIISHHQEYLPEDMVEALLAKDHIIAQLRLSLSSLIAKLQQSNQRFNCLWQNYQHLQQLILHGQKSFQQFCPTRIRLSQLSTQNRHQQTIHLNHSPQTHTDSHFHTQIKHLLQQNHLLKEEVDSLRITVREKDEGVELALRKLEEARLGMKGGKRKRENRKKMLWQQKSSSTQAF